MFSISVLRQKTVKNLVLSQEHLAVILIGLGELLNKEPKMRIIPPTASAQPTMATFVTSFDVIMVQKVMTADKTRFMKSPRYM